MIEDWSVDRWEDAIRAVFRRALSDPRFRALAQRDPRAAFTEANGVAPPDGLRLRFVDQLDEHVYVLPRVAMPFGELSEIDISRILHHAMRQQSIPPAFAPAAPSTA